MKKTIAAILVTILASAGYIVLDKASVEKIDRLESQVSAQQEVIDHYIAPSAPLEMHTGQSLVCYPSEGTVVQAYVRDLSRTTTSTTTATTTTTTTTTKPDTTHPIWYGTTYTPTTVTSTTVHAQGDEPTATTRQAETQPPMPSKVTTTKSQWTPTETEPTSPPPTTGFYFRDGYLDYYYPLRTDVRITTFRCEMVDKTLTGVPKFYVVLSGKVDPSFSGREIEVNFNDASVSFGYAYGTIRPDGSFSVSSDAVLANAAVIPLGEIRIN